MIDNDFGDIDDCDPDVILTGAQVVAAAAGRRITTPPGGLHYDPGYLSIDLESYQSRALTPREVFELRVAVERCVTADPRVAEATVDAVYYAAGMELRVTVDGTTVDGAAFELAATVDGEGVALAVAA